jgi:tetratricopeptide (TPR) repeat protein
MTDAAFESDDGEDYRLYRKASDEELAGRFETALKLYEESNRLRPHYKTCYHIGNCLVRLGRHQEAVVPLAAATALNRQGMAPFALAEVFMTLDEPDRALEFIQLALERQPHLNKAREFEPTIRKAAERRLREILGD